jgi:hypothetical protein
MRHTARSPVAFQSEPESIRSINHLGKLNRVIVGIERHALDDQCLRGRGDPEQLRFRRIAACDLDDALGPGWVDAVALGKDSVQRLPVDRRVHQITDNLDALEVAPLGQVHVSLADRRQAHAESLTKLSLAGYLRAGVQAFRPGSGPAGCS